MGKHGEGMNKDRIEFYEKVTRRLLATVESSMILPIGSQIGIGKDMWSVVQMTFAFDFSDDPIQCRLRCNVDGEKE